MRAVVFGVRADRKGPFHAYDGWYFQSDDEGNVQVQHRTVIDGGRGWRADASIVFDAATWASIVREVGPDA